MTVQPRTQIEIGMIILWQLASLMQPNLVEHPRQMIKASDLLIRAAKTLDFHVLHPSRPVLFARATRFDSTFAPTSVASFKVGIMRKLPSVDPKTIADPIQSHVTSVNP